MDGLAGRQVLVAEDEWFIAADLRRAPCAADAAVIGPVARCDRGLALADMHALDGAVLDVNLDGAMSFPIAARLRERRIPYLFLTGYDRPALPAGYRDDPRLMKPFAMPALLARLAGLLTPALAA